MENKDQNEQPKKPGLRYSEDIEEWISAFEKVGIKAVKNDDETTQADNTIEVTFFKKPKKSSESNNNLE